MTDGHIDLLFVCLFVTFDYTTFTVLLTSYSLCLFVVNFGATFSIVLHSNKTMYTCNIVSLLFTASSWCFCSTIYSLFLIYSTDLISEFIR